MWSKATASFADANVPGLSTDGAYQCIYRAALQATLATLAVHGLRVKSTANHYISFYALQKLTDALQPHGIMFNEMRAVRNDSVYEVHHDAAEIAERLTEARVSMPGSLAALRSAILAARPGLAARLPHVR